MTDQNILDKSMRSVFVGNIPYEATEEKLKDIFSEVGPVISFKLVYDRETGKPKGYGFCEYKDQETALSAMRNLNGYEIGGRTLRVDNACTEKSRLEMQSLMMGMPSSENHYGEAVSAEKAPEAISTAVASLPPEQMYELMKQMKACIQNNPTEARNMLLQNPQLGYALLQAQIIMKIVDPQVAASMLQSSNQVPPTPIPNNSATTTATVNPIPHMTNNDNNVWAQPKASIPPMIQPHVEDMDLRQVNRGRVMDQDLRQPPIQMPITQPLSSIPVESSIPPPLPVSRDPRAPVSMDSDIRTYTIRDPRANSSNAAATPPQMPPQVVQQPARPQVVQQLPKPGSSTDTEKAALIMQVLQLTEEQISKLPAEQRQSILVLKEQIAKSAQR
ncbi:cleavage stimulation factor subunit 2 tau variant [Rhopalosiphum maidis]|uniref:cleavage stimulation factor subunit 2 tau variant n=1 Tax=Rhopalosiphum maidis TaxID=43146 RepID=UPI000F0101DD|nr:cleavage stimulation factor subunit 2 tau variant [Rhopalosiphum maidis]